MPVKIQEKKDQKELSKYKTMLANGVTVELIGMCEYPSAANNVGGRMGADAALPGLVRW